MWKKFIYKGFDVENGYSDVVIYYRRRNDEELEYCVEGYWDEDECEEMQQAIGIHRPGAERSGVLWDKSPRSGKKMTKWASRDNGLPHTDPDGNPCMY